METAVVNPYLRELRPGARRSGDDAEPRRHGLDPARARRAAPGATVRTRSSTRTPAATTGSPATGCSTASSSRSGQARYRNRWVRTDARVRGARRDAARGQPDDVFAGGSSVANTTSSRTAASIFALVETSLPTEVRADLSTVGRVDFGGALRSPMTAHPKLDPLTGELVFFGYDIFGPPYLRYHVIDAHGQPRVAPRRSRSADRS